MTYLFFRIVFGQGETYRLTPIFVRTYEYHDRFSLFQSLYVGPTVGPDGSHGQHMYVDLITPLHDDCADITCAAFQVRRTR